jgi:hypothetical protein
MADIKQRIIASDETSAAYASARKRVNDYSGAVRSSAQQQQAMGTKAMQSKKQLSDLTWFVLRPRRVSQPVCWCQLMWVPRKNSLMTPH